MVKGNPMSAPTKANLKIYQGSTFSQVIRWETGTKLYAPITNINRSAPMVIQSPGHQIPQGWRVKVSGASGMKEVNTGDYIIVSSKDSNSLTFNEINAISYTQYTGGGVLEYHQPQDLTGYTARMQIRPSLTSNVIIKELSTENGSITVNNTAKTITLSIPAAETQLFDFKTAVYSLEMINGSTVVPFMVGSVSLVREATR